MTRFPTHRRSAGTLFVLAALVGLGCGSDHDSPGPGGSTISGNVSNASTAAVTSARSKLFAWLGESVIGLARNAYAQSLDVSRGGITVVVRGGGREVSDLTDASGSFVVSDAPTGDVVVLFRRGSCEASLPVGGVLSSSTITLSGVSFLCASGSATATVNAVGESFAGVLRGDPAPSERADVNLCVRRGDNDVERHVNMDSAAFQGDSGNAIEFGALDGLDLVQVDGGRSGAGETFTFTASNVRVTRHDVKDDCIL
jgi:hypothetical protein